MKVPKIECQTLISQFNEKAKRNRQINAQDAEKRFETEQKREIMNNVLQNLHKKDSIKNLLDLYQSTLHLADHV
jgi:hypothetical protein